MGWIAIQIDRVPRERVDDLLDLLWAQGAQGTQEAPATGLSPSLKQPWDNGPPPPDPHEALLTAWFEDPERGRVERAIRDAGWHGPLRWSEDGAEVDWETEWQKGFPPVRVGPLSILPPWLPPEPGAIVLEPGSGFGTGQHTTTRQALTLLVHALQTPQIQVKGVLDVGTGSGLLALGAARLGHQARGIDIEDQAIQEARRAARLNDLHVDFSTTPIEAIVEPVDVVVANIHAEALLTLAPHLHRLARHHLIVAGVMDIREEEVQRAFNPQWGPPHQRQRDEDWVALWWTR